MNSANIHSRSIFPPASRGSGHARARLPGRAAAIVVMAGMAACATQVPAAADRATPAIAPAPASAAAATAATTTFARSVLGSIHGASPLDESIGLRGAIGTTVNQVVPIPGTDMIKVGAVQEGTLFQSSSRNPTADGNDRAGATPNGAVVLFHVDRP